jgi:hypothetical protein
MIFDAARAVHGEVAAGRSREAMLFAIRLQRKFGHQLGPSVGVVRVVGAFRQAFREEDFLADVRLEKVGVDAAGRSENDFVNFGLQRFPENQTVEEKIGRRPGLVQIDVSAPAVVGGEMKYRMDSLHRCARDARFAQIGANEFNVSRGDVAGNVAKMPARQIVNDANFRAALNELIGKGRTDKRRSSCNQN